MGTAVPFTGAEVTVKLTELSAALSGVIPADIDSTTRQAAMEMSRWSEETRNYSALKTEEVKQIVLTVASLSNAVGERDTRYAREFSGLASRLQGIARLDDLSAVRKSLAESTAELTASVSKMKEEGERSLLKLREELAGYRTRLEETELRASLDSLTGLANRAAVEREIDRRMAERSTFGIMLLDLNLFKEVNDKHGHQTGDDLLKLFAAELRSQFPVRDFVGRWGGDEFIATSASSENPQEQCDRLRRWLSGDYKVKSGNESITLRVATAIGFAAWDGKESAARLVDRADSSMYADKQSGKPKQVKL